jgi:hypothetical protein
VSGYRAKAAQELTAAEGAHDTVQQLTDGEKPGVEIAWAMDCRDHHVRLAQVYATLAHAEATFDVWNVLRAKL